MADGCPSEDDLLSYAAGKLAPGARGEVETHLDTCEGCLRVLAALGEPASGEEGPGAPASAAGIGVGTVIGRYRIVAKIGEGGMGAVFRAFDQTLERHVALKVLRGKHTDHDAGRSRMAREAKAMAKLNDPHVVAVYDTGDVGGAAYIAMELIDGGTLADWLRERPRSSTEIVAIFLQAARGLLAAHAVGIVHRDFKPSNVLIARTGRVAVTDFGLAFPAPTSLGSPDQRAPTSDDAAMASWTVTQAGAVMGTPHFMSPEQRTGDKVDARSDQYSFALSLYESLFGRTPFSAETTE